MSETTRHSTATPATLPRKNARNASIDCFELRACDMTYPDSRMPAPDPQHVPHPRPTDAATERPSISNASSMSTPFRMR